MKKLNSLLSFLALAIVLCVSNVAKAQCPATAWYESGPDQLNFTYSSISSNTLTHLRITVSSGSGSGSAHTLAVVSRTATWIIIEAGALDATSVASLIEYRNSGAAASGYSDCNTSTALPVTLTTFSGKLLPNKVLLNWVTATEINNEKFDVERSLNGVDFIKVGEVKGRGNSNQLNNYSYSDNTIGEVSNTTLFYRLKQVDFSGEFEYSHTTLVKKTNAVNGVTAYPNPANTTLTVALNNPELLNTSIEIAGLDGKTYMHTDVQTQTATMDISTLAKGIYVLKVSSADNAQVLSVQKLIIQ